VELIRSEHHLSNQHRNATNRWLFLRNLTTRVRLEHLWNDLKLLLKEDDDHPSLIKAEDGTLSQRQLYLWQICMCMATRIFHGLVFDKLHIGENMTGHWSPYFTRYISHLRMLEQEQLRIEHLSGPGQSTFQAETRQALLWLYFMGSAVECLIFHRSDEQPSRSLANTNTHLSCTEKFMDLYKETELHADVDVDVVQVFEEQLLFSADALQRVLERLMSEP
jgi:hypothetical protein